MSTPKSETKYNIEINQRSALELAGQQQPLFRISQEGWDAIPSIMDTTSTDISPNMCQITQSHSQIIASASSVLVVSILLVVLCLFILVCVFMYYLRTGHYIIFVSLLLLCL